MSKRIVLMLILLAAFLMAHSSDRPHNNYQETALLQEEIHPWIEMMSLVPASVADEWGIFLLADWNAPFEVRNVELPVNNLAELMEIEGVDGEPSLISSIMNGNINSLPNDLRDWMRLSEMVESVGFDWFDINTSLTYRYESEVLIVQGDYDEVAIQTAFESYGYVVEQEDGLLLMCNAAGCETDSEMRLSNPFESGENVLQPVLFSNNLFITSQDYEPIDGIQAVRTNVETSLLDLADYRAVMNVATKIGTPIQMRIVTQTAMYTVAFEYLPPQQIEAAMRSRLLQPSSRETWVLPPYSLAFMSDAVEDESQLVYIGLIYGNESDAQLASERVESNINNPDLVFNEGGISQWQADIAATFDGTQVIFDEDTGRYITLVFFRAPLASNESGADYLFDFFSVPDTEPYYVLSSELFYNLIPTWRDPNVLWLATEAWFEPYER